MLAQTTLATVLIAFAIGGNAVAQSQEMPPQTPQVQTDKQPDSTAKSQSQSDQQTRPANQEPTVSQQHAPGNSERQADSDAQKRAEEAREYWPFLVLGARLKITDSLLALFTFFLIVVGAIQGAFLYRTDQGTHKAADAAKQSADIASQALVTAHRPWIKVDLEVGGPISYNVNGANFKIRYHLKNAGQAVATNIWVHVRILAPAIGIDTSFDPSHELQKLIAELKTKPPDPLGHVIFRDETITLPITVTIGAEELKRITQKVEFIHPVIVGAVDYRFELDDKAHQTGFVIGMSRSDRARPESTLRNRQQTAIFPDEGDISAEDVRIFRFPLAGGYAD